MLQRVLQCKDANLNSWQDCLYTPAYSELFVASPMPQAVDQNGLPVAPESKGAIAMGSELLQLAEVSLGSCEGVD